MGDLDDWDLHWPDPCTHMECRPLSDLDACAVDETWHPADECPTDVICEEETRE